MAAAAVAETVALRARPEPGSQPGGPSLLRTPAEPSPALAGRGSLLPGKQSWSAARAGRAWAWGALSARTPGTQRRAPVPSPLRPDPGGARGALCAAPPRRGPAWGPRGGRGRRGREAGRRGHVTGLFTNTAGPRRLPAEGPVVARVPGSGSGSCARSRASLECVVWRMGLGHRVAAASQHSFCGLGLRGGRWGVSNASSLRPVTLGLGWRDWVRGRSPRGPRLWGTGSPRNSQERLAGPGTSNRSRVPAWQLPGASPLSLPRGWAPSCLLPDGM